MLITHHDIFFHESDGTLIAGIRPSVCAEHGEDPDDWNDITNFGSNMPDRSTIDWIECPNHRYPGLADIVDRALVRHIAVGNAEVERYFKMQSEFARENNYEDSF